MTFKKGVAHTLLVIIVVIVLLVVTLLAAKYIFHTKIPGFSKGPKVVLKTQYHNPFDKKSQYVNPFSDTKNPFINLAKK